MQQLHSGDKQRPVQRRHGPASRVTSQAQEQVRDWVREQPDLTEAELCERLQGIGVSVGRSRVGRLLRQMGLRRKKNLSTRPSGTRKPTASGEKSSSRPSPPFPQRS
jgi:transposase